MNRRELLEILAVERHAPSPRAAEQRFEHPWPQMPAVTPEQAAQNVARLMEALDAGAVVIDFNERRSA